MSRTIRWPRLIIVTLIAAIGIAGFTSLGIWQVKRLHWKLDLIERVDARVTADPVPAPGPADWPEIAKRIKTDRAGGQCECRGECGDAHPGGRCSAREGEFHPVHGGPTVLTCAHWPDHNPANCDDDNLRAWCRRCHLKVDHPAVVARKKYGSRFDGPQQNELDL